MWSNEVCQYISFISLAVENVSSTVTTGKFSPNFCVQCPRCHCWNHILFLTTETKYLCFLWQYYLLRVLLITHTGRVIWTSFSFRLVLICLVLALLLPHKVMTFPPPICNGAIGGKAYTLWSHVPSVNPTQHLHHTSVHCEPVVIFHSTHFFETFPYVVLPVRGYWCCTEDESWMFIYPT